jgi:hypothetical protein
MSPATGMTYRQDYFNYFPTEAHIGFHSAVAFDHPVQTDFSAKTPISSDWNQVMIRRAFF